MVLRPGSVDEVAALVRLCGEHDVPIILQDGNTGLCGDTMSDMKDDAVVVSLQYIQYMRAVDPISSTITADIGCILVNVQQAVADVDCLSPLSLTAEDSYTIDDSLMTNVDDTAVLRYDDTRELYFGTGAVPSNGELWDGLRSLHKNNTGYDLRDLPIGVEDTLDIITGVIPRLFPPPRVKVTVLAVLQSPRQALTFLSLVQGYAGMSLTGLELMSVFCLELVYKHYPRLCVPFT